MADPSDGSAVDDGFAVIVGGWQAARAFGPAEIRTRRLSLQASNDVSRVGVGAGDGDEEATAVEGAALDEAAFLDAESTFCVPLAALSNFVCPSPIFSFFFSAAAASS